MTVHSIDRESLEKKLESIGQKAADTTTVFNNLGHLLTEEMLLKAYRQLSANKAVGIDDIYS